MLGMTTEELGEAGHFVALGTLLEKVPSADDMFGSFMSVIDQAVGEGLVPKSVRAKIAAVAKQAKAASAAGDQKKAEKLWQKAQDEADKAIEYALISMSAGMSESQRDVLVAMDEAKERPHGPPAGDKRTQKVLARYYDEIRESQPGKSKEYYARVSWQRYCMYKNPDNPSCGPAGKSASVTTGPKSEEIMDLDDAFERAVDGVNGLEEKRAGRELAGAKKGEGYASEVGFAKHPAVKPKLKKGVRSDYNRAVRRSEKQDIDQRMSESKSTKLENALVETNSDYKDGQRAGSQVTTAILNQWAKRPTDWKGWMDLVRRYGDEPDGAPSTNWRKGFKSTLIGQRLWTESTSKSGWNQLSKHNDGYESWEFVDGNVEMQVNGTKSDWDWSASTVEGKHKGQKGNADSLKAAKSAAERVARRLNKSKTENVADVIESILDEGINTGGVAGSSHGCKTLGHFEAPPTANLQQSGQGKEPGKGGWNTGGVSGASQGWYEGHYDRIGKVKAGDTMRIGPYEFNVKQVKHQPDMVKLILVSGDGGIRDQFELAIPKTPTQDIAMVDYGGRVRDFGISEVRVPGGGVAEETAEPTLDELFEISAGGQVGPTPKASDGPTEQVKMALKGAKSAIDSWLEKNTPVDWKPMNTQPSVANNLYMGEVVRLAYYAPMTPAEVRVSIGRPEVDINVSTKTNDQGMFTVIVRAKTKHNRDWTERTMSMKLADMKKPDKLLGWCRKLRW